MNCAKWTARPFLFTLSWRQSSTSAQSNLKLPQYIKRGHTDLLKALSSTVKPVFSGPLYKYHDDPYLIPKSGFEKKSYSLSEESGRKAARWFVANYPQYFVERHDDPIISKYTPKFEFDEKWGVCEDLLSNFIRNMQVDSSKRAFRALSNSNTDISEETMQRYLELMCFSNEQELVNVDYDAERLVKSISSNLVREKNWKHHGEAETIFMNMENPSELAYCAMIRGAMKFGGIARGISLYEEALSKNFRLDTKTYNSVIEGFRSSEGSTNEKWAMIRGVISTMVKNGAKPDLGTLNALMVTLAQYKNWDQSRTLAMSVLAEFKKLGIKPALGIYYLLLDIFYDIGTSHHSGLLFEIIDDLERNFRNFELLNERDSYFLFRAMEVACMSIGSMELAHKIHNLALNGNNWQYVAQYGRENLYFRNYFKLMLNELEFEEFMKIYESYVPNFFSPGMPILTNIMKVIEVNGHIETLPRIWSDVLDFNRNPEPQVVSQFLRVILSYYKVSENSSISSQVANIAIDMWNIYTEHLKKSEEKNLAKSWEGFILSELLEVLMFTDQAVVVKNILSTAIDNRVLTSGPIEMSTLKTCLSFSKNTYPKIPPLVFEYIKMRHADSYESVLREYLEKNKETSD